MEDTFYQLSDPTQDSPEELQKWIEQLIQNGTICSQCNEVLTKTTIDAYLNEKVKKCFAPITYVRGTSIVLLRKDLISILGEKNLQKVYFIGKVYDVNQQLSTEYISLTPKFSIFVRGKRDSICRICEECGQILYFPLPLNFWYLVKNTIPNLPLFPSALSGIIVNEEIYKAIIQSKIKKIGKEKLTILEKPLDDCDEFFETKF